MNTPLNTSKKPKGQTLSKKEQAQIEKEQKEYLLLKEKQNEFANTVIYEGLPFSFCGMVRNAFAHFSDLMLKMPWEIYHAVVSVKDNRYNYNQVNICFQVINMANADQLGLSIDDYVSYKQELQELMKTYETNLEANKERIKSEISVAPAGTA